MPVFTCGGGCPRLISVSSIPGGNPEALKEPEAWATVYLLCTGCKTYFCDRCLAKAGKSMQETACPKCKGALVNPNTPRAPATPAVTPGNVAIKRQSDFLVVDGGSGDTKWLQSMGENGEPCLTRVVVSGSQLALPPVCVCCTRPAEGGTREYSHRKTTGRTGNTVHYKEIKLAFPYCKACETHQRTALTLRVATREAETNESQMGTYCFILLGLPVLVGGPTFFIGQALLRAVGVSRKTAPLAAACPSLFLLAVAAVGLFLYTRSSAKKRKDKAIAERDAAAAKLPPELSPTCARKDDEPVQLFIGDGSTAFVFHNKVFALAFAELNRAALVAK